jgi:membrane protease YdiL (CAAX protease family)
MKDQRICSKCNYTAADTKVVRCPKCKSWMPKAQSIRRRGWILIFLGLLLVGMVGTITFALAPSMLSAGSPGNSFTGTPEQAYLVLGLFAVIITFGLTGIFSGIWQIVTGRRNIWIVIVIVILLFLIIVATSAVRKALDHKSDRGMLEHTAEEML